MTGEKEKGTTVEKLWNLDDKQLKTPEHDKLICLLLNEEYMQKIILKEYPCMKVEEGDCWFIESEVPIKNEYNNFIIGYWDIILTYENKYNIHDDRSYSAKIFIEVKPKIDSFGSVLRQIKTYKEFYSKNDIKKYCMTVILFTPDTRFDKEFESQRIKVVHPIKEENTTSKKQEDAKSFI